MTYRITLLIILLCSSLPSSSYAQRGVLDNVIKNCKPTPTFEHKDYYPGERNITRTNNLRRNTGSALKAKGTPIYLTGRILDENCVPVSDAEVQIWQANAAGKYRHSKHMSSKAFDANFRGAGLIQTDNLGQYGFLTVFPGAISKKSAPMIQILVKRKGFKDIYTRIFFPEQPANEYDGTLNGFSRAKQKSLFATPVDQSINGRYTKSLAEDGDEIFVFDITMKGKNQFRRY